MTRAQARIRAPELSGAGGWIGTDGRDLSLAALRGRVVLLDFWTSCCVNCLHVLDELRPLEARFPDVLVVIGVHSPKFAHETDHATVVAAVERYDVPHPVLDDPDLVTWGQYAIRAWPTLVVVDPEGYVVHVASGEGHGEGLTRIVEELVEVHTAKGTLRRGDSPWTPPARPAGPLLFPGKALALPDGTLLVSDTAHHDLVVLSGTGDGTDIVVRRIGAGVRGFVDGLSPRFSEPQGLALLPSDLAREVGYDVVVADSTNHALRGLVLATGEVRTLAGTGHQWMQGSGTGPDPRTALSTPWDVAWSEQADAVMMAMAGTHQLWSYDPRAQIVAVVAGTTGEGLRDGAAAGAYLAQPSGLAAGRDRTWFVDAETSALRWWVPGEVGTAVGTGLFDFGHRDGPAADALLQHPLGVAVLPDGSVAVCDTYNGAVRRYDPVTDTVTTLATGLAEPSGAVVEGDLLVVVESAAHRVVRLRIPDDALVVDGVARRTVRPVSDLAAGPIELVVVFEPPSGQHLDEREGPATRLVVTASPPDLLLEGAGASTNLARGLVLSEGEGVLHVSARAASCDLAGEHGACHITQQDWGIPVRVTPGSVTPHVADRLALVLRGLDA